MVKIQIRKNEHFEAALKRFKKTCARAGVFSESKRVAHFEKPAVRRRREEKTRIATIKKAQHRRIRTKSGPRARARTRARARPH